MEIQKNSNENHPSENDVVGVYLYLVYGIYEQGS